MSTEQTYQQSPEVVANPGLWQVKEFVDEEPQAAVNPLSHVFRNFRGIWIPAFLAATVFACLLGFAGFSASKPIYESQGLVRVVAKEAKILYADNDDSRLRLYDAFVSAEVTYLMSQPVLERAYEIHSDQLTELGLEADIPGFKDFIDRLSVEKLKGLIGISAASGNAADAQATVNALLRSYVTLHTEQSGSRKSLRARELEVRAQQLQEQQFQLGQQLLAVGEEYDASSLAKAHLTKVTQLEELDIRIDELANSLMEMEASNGALDADTGDMEIKRATLLDRAMADMVFERAKRAAELEKLLLRYQPVHPKVRTLSASLRVIDEAIETRRRLIATLGKTGAITGGDGADQEQSVAELEALKRKLTTRRGELSEDAKDLNGKLIKLRRLNEEKAQIAGMLAETRRILDQVNLENRTNLPGTIEILSRGSMPQQPAKDKRMQFALLGFMFGGGLIVAVIFLKRQFSDTVRYSDDLISANGGRELQHVFPAEASDVCVRSFLNDLQLSDNWGTDSTTVISMLRFADTTKLPIEALARIASDQGLKTLFACVSEDASGDKGFIESLSDPEAFEPKTIDNYQYVGFGQTTANANYSVESAKNWLRSRAKDYDLIILYVGVAERHTAARTFPKLSHITVPAIAPGNSIRQYRRLLACLEGVHPLFLNADAKDPGLALTGSLDPLANIGDVHEQAA